jgi:membrane protease YdiL (CAAX protease family)
MEQPRGAEETPATPWSAAEICLALFLAAPQFGLWLGLVFALLQSGDVVGRLCGAEAAALVNADDAGREQQRQALGAVAGPGAAEVGLPLMRRLVLLRIGLWAMALAFPLQAFTIPFVLHAVSGTRPAQLGLTTRRLGRNLLLGFGGFLVLSPLVLAINDGAERLNTSMLGGVPQVHPLTLVAWSGPTPVEWALLVFSGVVAAPVLEELVFRGLLQRYFAAHAWGGHAALALAFAVALLYSWGQIRAATSLPALLTAAAPALFILALVPVYLLVVSRSPTAVGPALFGTSALFGAIHSNVWPSPVALFALALGLGWLAWRTRSLAGPMLLHGLFNGIACVRLLLDW